MAQSITCPGCKGVIPSEDSAGATPVRCQFCGATLKVSVREVNNQAVLAPPKTTRPVSVPADELDAFPKSRRPLPFERHRRELPKDIPEEGPGTPAFDPLKWRLVRVGLNLVFAGWAAILGAAAFFAVYWFGTFRYAKPVLPESQTLPPGGQFWQYTVLLFDNDVAWIRTLGLVAGGITLVGIVAIFGGQCLCMTAPPVPRARGLAIGAVVTSVIAIPAMVALPFFVQVEPPISSSNQQPAAGVEQLQPAGGGERPDGEPKKAEAPVESPPKVETPPADNPAKVEAPGGEDAAKGEAPAAAPAPKPPPPFPAATVPALPRLLILGGYFVSQVLFLLFLKQVALFFHNASLADSTSGYLTLLFVHTAFLALLPPAALVACFFWVIMLALEFLLVGWLLVLVAGTRKAIG